MASVAACVAAAFSAPAASAGLLLPSCGATSEPFAAWGDYGAYCAFPNGGFESGPTGWRLSGNASVVAGNEPWYVSGSGTHALQLGPGASATSSTLPVALLDLWVRLFARSSSADGPLRVQVIGHGLLGNLTGVLSFSDLQPGDYASWQPTSTVLSAIALPLGTTSVQLRVTSEATQGSWQVDDTYLDPCLSKLG